MALPILAKTITSALVKKGSNAKKESKKVSTEKLLPGSVGNKVKVSKFKSRTPRPYRKKFEPTKFLPPSKIDENFDMEKLDDLLASLVDNTKDLEKITKKDVDDEKKKNTQKKNAKEKLKRSKKEEETEEKKAVVKVKSSPMKFKAPDFFKDILGMAGRLVFATGIMEVLNFLTDPKKKDGLINFLTEHLDKIILSTLAIFGGLFVQSFIPVVSAMVSFGLLIKPILVAMATLLIPMIAAGGLAVFLNWLTGTVIDANTGGASFTEQHRLIEAELRSNDVDTFIEADGTLKGRIRNPNYKPAIGPGGTSSGGPPYLDVMEHGTQEQKDAFTDYVAKRQALLDLKKQKDEELEGVDDEDLRKQIEEKYKKLLEGSAVETEVKPMVKPQTEVLSGVKLGGLQGDSGSVAYDGQERSSLSTQYSPFAQSDIDEQGMSIISGKGYRRSTDSDHKGFDIPAIDGTPVYAYLPGEITQNRYARGYGNIVEWRDSKYGQTHMFAHLKEPGPLSVGTKFEAGTMLARTGDTGTPGSYHLHWEIGAQGSEVDPGEWVKKHPLNFSASPKDQNVSYQAPYEKSGTQIAMVQVPTPVPMPSGGVGGSGGSSGGSGGNVNRYEDLVVTTHYREA